MQLDVLIEKFEKIKMPVRLAIFVGTIAILGSAFFFGIYKPNSEEISGLRETVDKLDRQLKVAIQKSRELEKIEARFAEVEAQLNDALKLLPERKEIPALLTSISDLGKESDLEFLLFSPRGEVPKSFYFEIPVSIQVSGTYHDVAVFFDKVGKMDRIVNIMNVSMKPKGALTTQLITSCQATTFRFEGKPEVQKTKGPVKK